MSDFRKDIERMINCHSRENGSDTPDWILAEYLTDSLKAFDKAVNTREKWYGRGEKFAPAPDGSDPSALVVEGEQAYRVEDFGC